MQENNDDLILLHCTHGFNRTGFLICAYIVEEEGSDVGVAVQEFAAARPQGIYKADYLQDLAERFGADEPLHCPGRPDWEDERYVNETNPESGALEPSSSNGKKKGRLLGASLLASPI